MTHAFRIFVLVAAATLSGCDAIGAAAEKVAEQARQELTESAQDALAETTRHLKQQMENARQATREWLQQERGEAAQDEPGPQPEPEAAEEPSPSPSPSPSPGWPERRDPFGRPSKMIDV